MQFLDLSFIEHGLRILMAWLCSLIYPIVSWLYDLFIYVSKVNVLSNDIINPIYQRVTLILTIIMVFYVTFEFVKYVVQPDTISDKEKGAGKIIYKMIAVVVLIAFVPSIFTGVYKIQNIIVEKNIIGKVVLGTKGSINDNFGGVFSTSVLTMFYSVNEEYANEECEDIPCGALVGMNITSLRENRTLPYITMGLGEANDKKKAEYMGEEQKVTEAYINFDGLFAVIVGGFIAYVLLIYCVDVGVRWAQLVFLQVIAPIPIIGFLAPKKEGIFQKWCKQCLTTYLDLFIRIALLNFIILICGILLDPEVGQHLFSNLDGISETMKNFVVIVLVLGLLLFAQKAPKLLGELFPKMGAASGNFGLKSKDRGINRVIGGAVGGAAGAIAGAATGIAQGWRRSKALGKDGKAKGAGAGIWGATKGAIRGMSGGVTRGVYNGAKKDGSIIKNGFAGAKKQVEANQKFGNREENGYTLGHQIEDRARGMFALKSRTQELEENKKPIKEQSDIYDKIYQSNKAQRDEAKKHVLEEGKGRYSGAYKEAAQRVRDLKEDAATRAEFKVGKYKSKEEAYDAYVDAIKDARQSINRQNFFNPDGSFNSSAYENACDRAAAKVKQEDFDSQVSKYSTQAEAEEAYRKALAEADQKLDEAEKIAINDYIDNGEWDASRGEYGNKDKVIEQHKAKLAAEMSTYNEYANSTRRINNITDVDGINGEIIVDENGNTMVKEKDPITGNEVVRGMTAKEFHTYAKAMASRKSANDNELIVIDNQINHIKNETEGSGIGEGKK